MSYRLGVDVGGTFTDLLLIHEQTGVTFTAKVPSTPEDSSLGVLDGMERICSESGVEPREVRRVMHGSTVATNAVLTGRGARVGPRAGCQRCTGSDVSKLEGAERAHGRRRLRLVDERMHSDRGPGHRR